LQADIDAMLDHCQQIIGTIHASGLSEEEFLGGGVPQSAAAPEGLEGVSPEGAGPISASAEAGAHHDQSPAHNELPSAQSSFVFLSGHPGADGEPQASNEGSATDETSPVTSFSFLSGLQVHEPVSADGSGASDLAAFLGGLNSSALPAETAAAATDFSIDVEQEDD
jgi:hypothetical protein